MRNIEVCLSPELVRLHTFKGKIAVVVDIFRATTCIVTGLAHGVRAIRPVAEIEDTIPLRKEGYLTAGERGGVKIDGFDLGNSPFDYQQPLVQGKKVAISTTNGSKAILLSADADEIVIGAFLNLNSIAEYVLQSKKDVIIHCAGWKGTISLEDSLFAGALIDECAEEMQTKGDAALIAHHLYMNNHENLYGVATQSGHAKRLAGFGLEKDLAFAMEENKYDLTPEMKDGELIL